MTNMASSGFLEEIKKNNVKVDIIDNNKTDDRRNIMYSKNILLIYKSI